MVSYQINGSASCTHTFIASANMPFTSISETPLNIHPGLALGLYPPLGFPGVPGGLGFQSGL
jgi:hypothetical protein